MKSMYSAAALAALAVAGAAAAAGSDSAADAGRMALNGYWTMARPPGPPPKDPPSGIPPFSLAFTALPALTPDAAAFNARYHAAEAAGVQQPTPHSRCLPAAVPGVPFSDIDVLVEPKVVAFLYENGRQARLVRMDAAHPVGLKPSWLGQSIGHWEADTLVVDTIGFNDKNMLSEGIPMTSKLHVVQRLRVVDGQLVDQTTLDDPSVFKAPFKVTTRYTRGEPFQESICAENNYEGGVPTADGAPTRPVELPSDVGR